MIFYVLKIADFSYCAIPRACNCEKKPSICTKIKIMAKLDGGGDYGENMEMSLARNIHPGDRWLRDWKKRPNKGLSDYFPTQIFSFKHTFTWCGPFGRRRRVKESDIYWMLPPSSQSYVRTRVRLEIQIKVHIQTVTKLTQNVSFEFFNFGIFHQFLSY